MDHRGRLRKFGLLCIGRLAITHDLFRRRCRKGSPDCRSSYLNRQVLQSARTSGMNAGLFGAIWVDDRISANDSGALSDDASSDPSPGGACVRDLELLPVGDRFISC